MSIVYLTKGTNKDKKGKSLGRAERFKVKKLGETVYKKVRYKIYKKTVSKANLYIVEKGKREDYSKKNTGGFVHPVRIDAGLRACHSLALAPICHCGYYELAWILDPTGLGAAPGRRSGWSNTKTAGLAS